jgi:hypothetical protein
MGPTGPRQKRNGSVNHMGVLVAVLALIVAGAPSGTSCSFQLQRKQRLSSHATNESNLSVAAVRKL